MTRSNLNVLHSFDFGVERTLHSLNILSKENTSSNISDPPKEYDSDNNNI